MKNYINSAFLCLCLGLCSCNNFIDLEPISQQSSGSFYKNAQEIDQALTAAYNALQDRAEYGGDGFSSFMEVRSDNTWNKNTTMDGGSYASFDNFSLTSTNPQIERTWIACYDGIQRANIVITRLNNNKQIDETFKSEKIAEAKFLRALTYFNAVRIWGDIPMPTEEIVNVNTAFDHTRISAEKVYAQIIEDLKYCSEHLKSDDAPVNRGRATKGAAQALLAKVYMTLHQWAEAKTVLTALVKSGQYALEPKFADVFSTNNKFNKEVIFAVQFNKSLETQGWMGNDPLIPGSDVNNLPSDNLISLFHANKDDRFDVTLKDMGVQGWRMYKWHDTKGPNNGLGFNIVILRYADVLLMLSETLNELGHDHGEALRLLNEVRTRSHAAAYSEDELSTQELFRQAIAKERRLELAFENQRWFDLVRTGEAVKVMNSAQNASILPITVKTHQLLFPIPQGQIDASAGKLTQNKDY